MTVQHLVLLAGSMLSVSVGAKACVMLTLRYCVVGGCWRLLEVDASVESDWE